jgi:hypothetical protein
LTGFKQLEISRAKFLGLGVSALVLSTGISPFVVKAQTVNFNAATFGKLSQYCKGDGSDETSQINKCLNQHLYVEIDEPPAGVGYGFHMHNSHGEGLLLRSGHEISGQGANSKLLRVGKWMRSGKCFRNKDRINGDSSIKLHNIYIEGLRKRPDVPSINSDADSTGIEIRALSDGKWCKDIQLTKVQVHNWPGVSMRVIRGWNITYTEVKSVNPSRGGVIFNVGQQITLKKVFSANSGDDAIAFYVTNGLENNNPAANRDISEIVVASCEAFTRRNPEYGAALKFGGAGEALVTNSIFRHAKNSQLSLESFPGGFNPRNIEVRNCKIFGGQKHSFQIRADQAKLISLRDSYLSGPAHNCVNIISLDGATRTFDVAASNNALVNPGSGKHINVQRNISGVEFSENKLLSSDDKPTINNVSPKPNSSIRTLTPIIQATVKDDATELRKGDIKLFFNGQAVSLSDFSYDRSRDLLTYKPPKLSAGKKTARIAATDSIGNRGSKVWSFTIDTTKPTITDVYPKPNSKVSSRTPTLKAKVRDNVTNLSKRNIKLYFNNKAVSLSDFSYDRSRDLLTYKPPKLSAGKKTARIAATDAAGNQASFSWSFTVG